MSVSRNAVYNLMGAAAPIITALLTIPLYLRVIGEQRYGVLAIVWIFVGYFGIFDIGLGRAVAQRIAALGDADINMDADADMRARVFWTAVPINAVFAALAAAIIIPVAGYYFSNYLHLTVAIRGEVMYSLPILTLVVFVTVASSCLTGALQGVEQFGRLNLVIGTGSVLFLVVPLCAAIAFGGTIEVVVVAVIAVRLFSFLWLLGECLRHVVGSGRAAFSWQEAKRLLSFGGWVAFSSIVSPLLVFADRMLIGAVLGAKAVTQYAVPYQLSERTCVVSTALASSLYPRFSQKKEEDGVSLSTDAVRALVVLMTVPCMVGILIAPTFLEHWVSADFANASAVTLQYLLIGFWFNSLARIPHSQLQGSGRPHLVAIAQCVELVPFFVILYVCLSYFGLAMAAAAVVLRLAADFVILSCWAGTFRRLLRPGLIGLGFLVSALAIAHAPVSWVARMLLAVSVVSICGIWCVFAAPPAVKQRFAKYIHLLRNTEAAG